MAGYIYHDAHYYKLKHPRDDHKGKHYFPIRGRDERVLYWVRRDLVEGIPWFYFSMPRLYEDNLVLEYDDFLEIPGLDNLTFEQILDIADSKRQARYDVDSAKVRQAHEMLDILEAQGVPIGKAPQGGGSSFWGWAALILVLILGFYFSATIYVFPKVAIRAITASTNISFPWGNVCRVPTGTSPEEILSDASQLFGTSVDLEPGYTSIQQVKGGRCLDGVNLTGAKINAVRGAASVLIDMESPADAAPVLPEAKGDGGCLFPLAAHPGKGLCQNVGPVEGNVLLIQDTALWLFVNEPDMKLKTEGDTPPPAPTAVVK